MLYLSDRCVVRLSPLLIIVDVVHREIVDAILAVRTAHQEEGRGGVSWVGMRDGVWGMVYACCVGGLAKR